MRERLVERQLVATDVEILARLPRLGRALAARAQADAAGSECEKAKVIHFATFEPIWFEGSRTHAQRIDLTTGGEASWWESKETVYDIVRNWSRLVQKVFSSTLAPHIHNAAM